MNIAFFTLSLKMGGYEKVVVNYANAFSENHKITVLCANANGELSALLRNSVQTVDFKCRTRDLFFHLYSWLKDNDIDVLYVPFITYTAIAVLIKKLIKKNFVIYSSQHGYCDVNIPLFKNGIIRLFRDADVHTAVSQTIADHFSRKFKILREDYYILNNPVFNSLEIPDGIFMQTDNKDNSGEPLFAISGRLAKDKHVEIAIKIIYEVNKIQPVRLLVLGDGPEKENLVKTVKSLNLKEMVRFEGYVEQPMMYFPACKALLLTSEVESFGNSIVEALYCNMPVIVTDCGGPVEIIENDRYGICIGRFDCPEVVENGKEAVLKIIKGEKPFGDFKEKALKYDASKLEKQFLQPYYDVIKRREG